METKNIIGEPGIIITILLILIPVIISSIIVVIKAYAVINNFYKRKELEKFNKHVKELTPEEVQKLEQRKRELEFTLSNNELAGQSAPVDNKGLIDNIAQVETLRFIEQKKRSQPRPHIDPELTKLILYFLGCAAFWLLFGTTIVS